MTQTFTLIQNEIIRYAYDETSPPENLLIEDLIANSNEHLDFYLDCITLKAKLDAIVLDPENDTIDTILDFSKNYKPVL